MGADAMNCQLQDKRSINDIMHCIKKTNLKKKKKKERKKRSKAQNKI